VKNSGNATECIKRGPDSSRHSTPWTKLALTHSCKTLESPSGSCKHLFCAGPVERAAELFIRMSFHFSFSSSSHDVYDEEYASALAESGGDEEVRSVPSPQPNRFRFLTAATGASVRNRHYYQLGVQALFQKRCAHRDSQSGDGFTGFFVFWRRGLVRTRIVPLPDSLLSRFLAHLPFSGLTCVMRRQQQTSLVSPYYP